MSFKARWMFSTYPFRRSSFPFQDQKIKSHGRLPHGPCKNKRPWVKAPMAFVPHPRGPSSRVPGTKIKAKETNIPFHCSPFSTLIDCDHIPHLPLPCQGKIIRVRTFGGTRLSMSEICWKSEGNERCGSG